MNFNDPIFWSFVVTMCSIALLTERAPLVHVLFVTRQTLSWYLLLLVPLTVSIWSFCVAWYASNKFEYLASVTHIHINRAWWLAMISSLNHTYQVQIGIMIAVLAILLFIEGEVLPRSVQPPVWTLLK